MANVGHKALKYSVLVVSYLLSYLEMDPHPVLSLGVLHLPTIQQLDR